MRIFYYMTAGLIDRFHLSFSLGEYVRTRARPPACVRARVPPHVKATLTGYVKTRTLVVYIYKQCSVWHIKEIECTRVFVCVYLPKSSPTPH